MSALTVRYLPGLSDYNTVWSAMRQFVDAATDKTNEEIWLLQHPAVYTFGRVGDASHLLRHTDIPVIHSDRGGQITYHAPGQIIAYLLLNIRQRALGLRALVRQLEGVIITVLKKYGVDACGSVAAPGVYVDGEKIAALGLRVRRGWTYHGLSFNVQMDLTPFDNINPCGYVGLSVTQASDKGITATVDALMGELEDELRRAFATEII